MKGSVRLCKPFLKTVEDCEFRMGYHKLFLEKFKLKANSFDGLFVEGGKVLNSRFERSTPDQRPN
jgi:hypothetical protein